MSRHHRTDAGIIRGSVLDNRKVQQLIHNVKWSSLLDLDHISIYKKTIKILHNVYEQSTKSVNIKIRSPDKKWITHEIVELYCAKDKAWQKCRKRPEDQVLRDEYRALRNQVTAKMQQAKRSFFMRKFSLNTYDGKKTWQTANELMGRQKKASIDEAVKKNLPKENVKVLCDKFNDVFLNTTEQLRNVTVSSPVKY